LTSSQQTSLLQSAFPSKDASLFLNSSKKLFLVMKTTFMKHDGEEGALVNKTEQTKGIQIWLKI
jgi:hypothetical protein